MRSAALFALMWLATYLIHSTLLLGGAFVISRVRARRGDELGEVPWRVAMFGGVITASVQLALSLTRPSLLVFQSPATGGQYPLGTTFSQWPVFALATFVHDLLPRVAPAVVALWIAVALLRLGAFCHSHLMLRRLLADRVVLVDGAIVARARALCNGEVTVSISARIVTPMVFGARELCLPRRALDDLAHAELDAVLAHELAHVVRHDTRWLLLVSLIERVLFFQPLNAIACARIRALAECSCDDWALRRTRNPLALASALARVTGWLAGAPHAGFAVGMSSRESTAVMRVRRILDPTAARLPDSHSRHWALSSATLCAVILLAPGMSLPASMAPRVRYTIEAFDNAGPFSITLEQGRVVGVTLNGQLVGSALIDQHGASVHVEDPHGNAPLDLTLTPAGGMHWLSRPTR